MEEIPYGLFSDHLVLTGAMTQMPNRRLGRNGPTISAIGFGSMGLSAFYGSVASDEERFRVLDRVIELGINYIDSSDIYGDSEELLGKYFKRNPQQRQKVSKKDSNKR